MKKNLILLAILGSITALVAYLYYSKSNKSFDDSFADFSITDTAAVNKIFIVDDQGKSVLLERNEGKWSLNDSLTPRMDAVNMALRVLKDIKIQSPVAGSSQAQMLKLLSTKHKKVEIYQGGNDPVKIWYIGTPTQDHFGTNMLLEIPGKGKGDNMYITELTWHKGFITPMFFTDLQDWRNKVILSYPQLDFKAVEVRNFKEPAESFRIEISGPASYKLLDSQGKIIDGFDTILVKDYLETYRMRGFDMVEKQLTPAQRDSLLKSTPLYSIKVAEKSGKAHTVQLFRKDRLVRSDDPDDETEPNTFDEGLLYGYVNGRELLQLQWPHIDPLLYKLSDFRKK